MNLINKEKATDIVRTMLQFPAVTEELRHFFTDGMYCREMTVPAGTLMIGREHSKSSFNILSKGVMLIKESLEDEGTLIKAPFIAITGPGTQKLGYSLTECTFINVFRTDKTTVEEAVEDCTEPIPEEITELLEKRRLECQY